MDYYIGIERVKNKSRSLIKFNMGSIYINDLY